MQAKAIFTSVAAALSATMMVALPAKTHAFQPDAPFLVSQQQNKAKWAAEDAGIDKKLAALEKRFGKKPNIIFILTDDIGWGEPGWQYGGKRRGTPTPNLDRFAERSSVPTLISEAEAQKTSEERKYRNHYYPGTEQLAPDEMRVIALGTGMPNARMSQAGSCWLVELGNNDKFFFDLGTGCMEKFSVLGIPYGAANKVFLSHLHSDHYGGFQSWWMGGLVAGRRVGVEVWGPTGATPELGTKYAIDKSIEALNWDITSRSGRLPSTPLEIKVHEFDYKGINAVVYERNGVVVRSVPAIHAIDGPVSFILEWNGLKFVFSGDTTPNKWLMKYGKGADLFVHEIFFTIDDLQKKFGWSLAASIQINLLVHTAPPAFGKIMSVVKPRMAVAFHFFNDFDTGAAVHDEIRKTYDGPFTLAKDMMVWNVTPKTIKAREVAFSENSWPVEEPGPDPNTLPKGKFTPMSKFVTDGNVFFPGIISPQDACKRWPGVEIPGVKCE